MTKLKLARPREVPVLKLLGWEVCGDWSASFVLMQLQDVSRETVDLTKVTSQAA